MAEHFIIRHARPEDLPRMVDIYVYARNFMAEHGNERQWGQSNWPPTELLKEDIASGHSYICESDGKVVGTFYFIAGENIEPTYRVIEEGEWIGDENYGVIHRLAGDGSKKGIGRFCIQWALDQCGHLRIDTHEDNIIMQNMVTGMGFTYCGKIHVIEDPDIRFAYERIQNN